MESGHNGSAPVAQCILRLSCQDGQWVARHVAGCCPAGVRSMKHMFRGGEPAPEGWRQLIYVKGIRHQEWTRCGQVQWTQLVLFICWVSGTVWSLSFLCRLIVVFVDRLYCPSLACRLHHVCVVRVCLCGYVQLSVLSRSSDAREYQWLPPKTRERQTQTWLHSIQTFPSMTRPTRLSEQFFVVDFFNWYNKSHVGRDWNAGFSFNQKMCWIKSNTLLRPQDGTAISCFTLKSRDLQLHMCTRKN